MENNQNEGMIETKKSFLKIIIPILILAVVGGIWLFKKDDKSPAATNTNPDFALHVTGALDLEQLKSYGLPIMINFGADYCIPCKEMAPVLEKLNQELQGKAIIKYVDVWKYQDLAAGYPISVIPTQAFYDKEGKPYAPADPQASHMNIYSRKDTKEHVFTTHEGGMTEEMILAALKEMGMEE